MAVLDAADYQAQAERINDKGDLTMFLADCHMHSTCSMDGVDTMLAMARAAHRAGMNAVCFTEHCDMALHTSGESEDAYLKSCRDMLAELPDVRKKCGDMEILAGMELGEANQHPEAAKAALALPGLDFVIGSLHQMRDQKDFFFLQYDSEEHCRELLEQYMDELLEIARQDYLDVMAHIGYALRYMSNAGYNAELSLRRHGDKLEALFKTLIQNGRGIEMNVSGYRHRIIRGPIPSMEIITLYRELGGEIITIGADAHTRSCAGGYIREGRELLKELGFEYAAIYRQRKPEFYKI